MQPAHGSSRLSQDDRPDGAQLQPVITDTHRGEDENAPLLTSSPFAEAALRADQEGPGRKAFLSPRASGNPHSPSPVQPPDANTSVQGAGQAPVPLEPRPSPPRVRSKVVQVIQRMQGVQGVQGVKGMQGGLGEPGGPACVGGSGGSRRAMQIAGVRSWLKMLPDGTTSMVQLERHSLERELGVQLRDFRVLDAVLGTSYPSCILVRPHALIINLEMCKFIISRTYTLINNTDVDRVRPCVEALRDRLRPNRAKLGAGTHPSHPHPHSRSAPGAPIGSRPAGSAPDLTNITTTTHPNLPPLPPETLPKQPPQPATPDENRSRAGDGHGEGEGGGGPPFNTMPFELTVLEVCLEQVLLYLDRLASDLDSGARLATERLLARLTSKSLEKVRLLKNRIAFVQKKVGTSKELLRKLLEDDKAMAGMNLTARHDHEELYEAQRHLLRHHSVMAASLHAGGGAAGAAAGQTHELPTTPTMLLQQLSAWQDANSSMTARWGSQLSRTNLVHQLQALGPSTEEREELTPAAAAANRFLGSLSLEEARVLEEGSAIVEMLLEAFYLQLDQTAGKLESCAQAIHDTEDFINIKLDQHRNQLISIELMVSIGALVLGACAVVTGVFGMNMPNSLEHSSHGLLQITGWMMLAATLVWALIIGVAIHKGVITWVPWSAEGE